MGSDSKFDVVKQYSPIIKETHSETYSEIQIGKKLRTLRLKNDMTMKELAAKINIRYCIVRIPKWSFKYQSIVI